MTLHPAARGTCALENALCTGVAVFKGLPDSQTVAGRVHLRGWRRRQMLLKIYGGTRAQEEDSLCDSCRHSRIVRGRRLDEELVFCGAVVTDTVRIGFKVTSCTEYFDARAPGYAELVEHAWILRPASKRRAAGFVRAADLNETEALEIFRFRRD